MKKFTILLFFFLISFLAAAENTNENRMLGIWEGYYSGSHVHQGFMTFNISEAKCTVWMYRFDNTESINFDCKQLIDDNGIYSFSANKPFPTGGGFVEWKITGAFSVGSENKSGTQIFIGSWLQGMRKNSNSPISALNSGYFKLKLRKDKSIIEQNE